MKNFFFLILGFVVIFGSVFLFFERTLVEENEKKIIKINDTSIKVDVADTPETRTMGLSGRETLPEGTGMLFIFDSPVQDGFWMKDMSFAIDIVWIDEKSRIVGIEHEVTPETFPQVFYPNQPVKYVLELPARYINQHHIDIGAVVQWFD
ncbi:MAG: DUF192 domain-containing protein [Patescibacteria group bacterium]